MYLYGEQAVPYQVHAVFSRTVAVGKHDFCPQIQRSRGNIRRKVIDFFDIIGSVGDKRSGQHEHHNEVDNGV